MKLRSTITGCIPEVALSLSLLVFALAVRLYVTGLLDPVTIGQYHWMWSFADDALAVHQAGSFVDGMSVHSFSHPFGYNVLTLVLLDVVGVPHPLPEPFVAQKFLAISADLNEAMRKTQCVLDAVAVGVLSLGLARVFGLTTAAVAGFAYAVNPVVVQNLAIYMPDSLTASFAGMVAGTTAIAWRCQRAWVWIIPAAVTALAVLMRPDAIGMLPLISIVAMAGAVRWRQRLLRLAVIMMAFAVVMSPWWWTSYKRLGNIVWLSNSGDVALLYGIAQYGVPGPWVGFDEFFMNTSLHCDYRMLTAPEGNPLPTLQAFQPIIRERFRAFVTQHPLVYAETIMMRLRTMIAAPGSTLPTSAFDPSPLMKLGWKLHQPAALILMVGAALILIGWRQGLGVLPLIPLYPLITIGLTYFEPRYVIAFQVGYSIAFAIVVSALISAVMFTFRTILRKADPLEVPTLRRRRCSANLIWPIAMLIATTTAEAYHLTFDSVWARRERDFADLVAGAPKLLFSKDQLFPTNGSTEISLGTNESIRSTVLDYAPPPIPTFIFLDIEVKRGEVLFDYFDGAYARYIGVFGKGRRQLVQHVGLYNPGTQLVFSSFGGNPVDFKLRDIHIIDSRDLPVRAYMRQPNTFLDIE